MSVTYHMWYLLFIVIGGTQVSADLIDDGIIVTKAAYEANLLTTVVWWQSKTDHVITFLKKYHGAVLTIDFSFDINFNHDGFQKDVLFRQTVFFANEPGEFQYFLKIINCFIKVPIRVILIYLKSNDIHVLNDFTRISWENDVGDIVIISSNQLRETVLSTYKPYGNGYCDNHTAVVQHLKSDFEPKNIFKRKYNNFYGCPIRVTVCPIEPYIRINKINDTISIEGYDAEMLKLLMPYINATMNARLYNGYDGLGTVYPNKTATGCFGDLTSNMADIMAPSIAVTNPAFSATQVSSVYIFSKVIWAVPKRRELSHGVKTLMLFYNIQTLLILGCFVVCTVFIQVFQRFKTVSNKKNVPFILFGLLISQFIKFETNHYFVNSIYTLWIWFTMIIRIAFQGELIGGLRHVILEPRITTVDQALHAYNVLYGAPLYLVFYRNTSIEAKYRIIPEDEIVDYFNRIVKGQRTLLVTDTFRVKYYREYLDILDERVARMAVTMFLRPRWPASETFDRLRTNIIETGFTKTFKKFYAALPNTKGTANSYTPLNIITLAPCFYGLMLMWIICFLILCIEIIIHRYYKNH